MSLCSQSNILALWSWKPFSKIMCSWNIDHVFIVKRQQLTLDFPLSSMLPCSDFRYEQTQAFPKGDVSGWQHSEVNQFLLLYGKKKSWKWRKNIKQENIFPDSNQLFLDRTKASRYVCVQILKGSQRRMVFRLKIGEKLEGFCFLKDISYF